MTTDIIYDGFIIEKVKSSNTEEGYSEFDYYIYAPNNLQKHFAVAGTITEARRIIDRTQSCKVCS